MTIFSVEVSGPHSNSVYTKRQVSQTSLALFDLRATLPKILISNIRPEIDFAHNSSTNFTWQVGNKYEIISEKFNFFKNFLIGTFGIPECAQNVAVNSRILQDLQLSVLENTDHSRTLPSLVKNNNPLS